MIELTCCPSTLQKGFSTYSPVALKELFNSQKVNHILPYTGMDNNETEQKEFQDNNKHMSISGAQQKYSLVVDNGQMRLSLEQEQATLLLKTKLSEYANKEISPANEHLTMQIASQVYNIPTAANGLCFFQNDEPAYITRRFDIAPNGRKFRKEDFASLAGISKGNKGPNYKYDVLSYEEMADIIKQYVSASSVEVLKFFRLVIFNFLFSNGDAHAKNFSLLETPSGDFILAPAYDLLNTRLHIFDDHVFALQRGLFKENTLNGNDGAVTGKEFIEFGIRIGIPPKRVHKELISFCQKAEQVQDLVEKSFLPNQLKKQYLLHYQMRKDSYLSVGILT